MVKDYDLEVKLRQIVFRRTREFLSSGQKLSTLARNSGVAPATLSKLAYGETKHPRFHTIVGVCQALGVQLEVVEGKQSVVSFPTVGKKGRHG